MGFLWRRRFSVVKIVILLSAVWFTVAFLIYSEDRRTSDVVAQAPHNLELKYNNEFNDDNDDLNENSINNLNDLKNNYNNKYYVNKLQHQLNQQHLQTKNHNYNESMILNGKDNSNDNANSYNRNINVVNGNSNNINLGKKNKKQYIPYQRRNEADAQKNGAGLSDDNGEY